jgi:tRNA (cytidine32/uridine32-2'-O)-methyltransferase
MSGELLDPANVYFILVRPVYLGNIGSMARLIKNFGFSNLRLVDAPRNYKDAEARKMAVGAFDVLKKCATFETFHDSIRDMNFVIGTSAGQQRSQPLVTLADALEQVGRSDSANKIAVVLGDERNGLSNEELVSCHSVARIPTAPSFPSLNVAQAACVIAYELSKRSRPLSSMQDIDAPGESAHGQLHGKGPAFVNRTEIADGSSARAAESKLLLPSVSEDDELFDQVAILLDNVEFSRRYNKSLVVGELRQFYRRAMPTKRECDLLRGILHKLNQSIASAGDQDP